jgi:hypothetical protein
MPLVICDDSNVIFLFIVTLVTAAPTAVSTLRTSKRGGIVHSQHVTMTVILTKVDPCHLYSWSKDSKKPAMAIDMSKLKKYCICQKKNMVF